MFKLINDYENYSLLYLDSEEKKLPCGRKIKVYTIERVHDLIQFIGYGKYKNKEKGNVYFRGQIDLFDCAMIPSLFRNSKNYKRIYDKFSTGANQLICNYPAFHEYNKNVLEPLLQHYGIKTPWLDVVDNIWVALWFALHDAKSEVIKDREFVYYFESNREYSYIVLLGTDANKAISSRGIFKGKDTYLVDLRKASPSFYLRPHAQHAYAITKCKRWDADYSDLIVGIARIPTQLGLRWLGDNEFLKMNTLFPPVHLDKGYEFLMKTYPDNYYGSAKDFGSIQILTD